MGSGRGLYFCLRMKIIADSIEYKCWHEAGHVVCLHLGGIVDFIEFLDGNESGYARTRCDVSPEIGRSVACGGFAAEVYLFENGHAERAHGDKRDVDRYELQMLQQTVLTFWRSMVVTK